MRWYKIAALMYADMMLLRNTKWKIFEYVYFPITTILIWGLFSVFIRDYALEAGLVVLVVNILWNFAQVAQSHPDMQINEDSWSGSLKQIIISGVSDFEYITARILSGTIISIGVMALMMVLSVYLFDLTIVTANAPLFVLLMLITLVASIALSIFVAGIMVALGREYGFLAWTILQIFILLSAPFYPVSVFPDFLRPLVRAMPYTNIFEATRAMVAGTPVGAALTASVAVAGAYLIASIPFYGYIFRLARRKGWLVRLS